MITMRCARRHGPHGIFCLHVFRRGPVNVDVTNQQKFFLGVLASPVFPWRKSVRVCDLTHAQGSDLASASRSDVLRPHDFVISQWSAPV